MGFSASELILNPDQSIYHLNLHPEDLADTVITVGDPDRVAMVSRYFDHIEVRKGKREFITHTGTLNGQRITVISTGIGTDNVDIVMNELDALANIDPETKAVRPQLRQLSFVRVGTSGALQPEIPLDAFLLSEYALGLDSLLHFYKSPAEHPDIQEAFVAHMGWTPPKSAPYIEKADSSLMARLDAEKVFKGFTATNVGFYGPQGRRLRLEPATAGILDQMAAFNYRGFKITNMEMETSALYALSRLLGHRAVSLNCIVANRITGRFSPSPGKAVKSLIEYTLEKLTQP